MILARVRSGAPPATLIRGPLKKSNQVTLPSVHRSGDCSQVVQRWSETTFEMEVCIRIVRNVQSCGFVRKLSLLRHNTSAVINYTAEQVCRECGACFDGPPVCTPLSASSAPTPAPSSVAHCNYCIDADIEGPNLSTYKVLSSEASTCGALCTWTPQCTHFVYFARKMFPKIYSL